MSRRTFGQVFYEDADNEGTDNEDNEIEFFETASSWLCREDEPRRPRQRRESSRRVRQRSSLPSAQRSPPTVTDPLLPATVVTDLLPAEERSRSLDKQLDYALTAPELAISSKKIIVDYILHEASKTYPPDEVAKIFDVASRWVIHGSSGDVRSFALAVYSTWAAAHAEVMSFCLLANNSQLMLSWLGEVGCIGGTDLEEAAAAAAATACTSAATMQSPDKLRLQQAGTGPVERLLNASTVALSGQPRLQDRLLVSLYSLLPKYISQHNGDVHKLSWVATFVNKWDVTKRVAIVDRNYHSRRLLCKSAIISLALVDLQGLARATTGLVMSEVTTMFSGFWTAAVFDMIQKLRLIYPALDIIFLVASGDDPQHRPQLLLASVLETIPVNEKMVIERCYVLLTSDDTDEHKSNLLLRLIAWMKWPSRGNISLWAATLWDIACSLKLYKIMEVALPAIEKLSLVDGDGDQEPMQLSADEKVSNTVAKPYGKTGLVNHDSLACYANVVLQMLFASTRFRNAVLHTAGAIPGSPREADQPVLGQLQRVFAFLAFSEAASYDACDFRATSMPPHFITSREQQDASELVTHVLDRLVEQELANRRRPLSTPTGLPASDLASLPLGTESCSSSDAAKEQPEATDSSIITTEVAADAVCLPATTSSHQEQQPTLGSRYFRGFVTRQYKCLECGFVSQMPDQFYQLAVHLTSADEKNTRGTDTAEPPITVASLIQRELRDEQLVKDDQRYCDQCQCKRDAVRSCHVSTAPDCLIVSICPFAYDRAFGTYRKICARVRCDDHLLLPTVPSQPASTTEPSPVEYKLRAVVIHRGMGIGGGHYICIARHDRTGAGCSAELSAAAENEWFKFDDADVSPIDFNSTAGDGSMWNQYDTPYLLLYECATTMVDRQTTDITQAAASTADIGATGGTKTAESGAAATDTTLSMLMNLVKSTDARNASLASKASTVKFGRQYLTKVAASVKTSSCRPQSPSGSLWDNDDDEDEEDSKKYAQTGSAQNDITGSRFVF